MTDNRPLILISNDDGVAAKGIRYLIEQVKDMGDVVVVAPDEPQSGKSSALTFDRPLRITNHPDYQGAKVYSVSGTPVDCVKLAFHTILDRKPDLMLCGVNHGSNAAINAIYSGTMGAVMEACIVGIPAIGFSLLHHSLDADFSPCTEAISKITTRVLAEGLPEGICLNVNIPAKCTPRGIKVVRAARGYWTEEYADYVDPIGKPFYMVTGRFHNSEPGNDQTDEYWLAQQYTTVVATSPYLGDFPAAPKLPDFD